ncbi:MAG: cupin domain-containing protein [Acidobacteria bacterium]|nr:cupin domain-containing protein [Acidobacteriota bacterium]
MNLRHVLGACLWLVLAFAVTINWIGHAQQTAQPPVDDPRFTGKTSTLEAKDLSVSRRRFEAGARSAWHSHDRGQLVFVQEGRARIQKRGQTMRELGPGDSDYTGPNVVHWHGAVPDQPLVQIAVGFGGETKWMEKVTDAEYAGKT